MDSIGWLAAHCHAALKACGPHASGAASESSGGWWNTYGGAAVTASLVTVFLGGLISFLTNKSKDRSQALRELRIQALNEFYAPIKTHLASNRVLSDALRIQLDVTGDDWHVLDHLAEVEADPEAMKLIKEILRINKRIAKILESKSGLELGQSAHVAVWEVHRRLLDRAFDSPRDAVKGELTYFPKGFESDIVTAHRKLMRAVKSSVGDKT